MADFERRRSVRPAIEARRYEARYGPVQPYRTVHEYDRGRTQEARSPDDTARHFARAERTPLCVRRGRCVLGNHDDKCPNRGTEDE